MAFQICQSFPAARAGQCDLAVHLFHSNNLQPYPAMIQNL
jgi:hypothetical protein